MLESELGEKMAYWCINVDESTMDPFPFPTVIDARRHAIRMIDKKKLVKGVMISKYVTPLSNAEGVVQKVENGYIWTSRGKKGKRTQILNVDGRIRK